MVVSPLFVVGVVVFALGFILFASVLFSNGGVRKSMQFRVMGELYRGLHGRGARLGLLASLPIVLAGACLLFGAVAASDHDRAKRCEARCTTAGYDSSRIGPNSDRTDDRTTWFVACICEGGDQAPQEFRAAE